MVKCEIYRCRDGHEEIRRTSQQFPKPSQRAKFDLILDIRKHLVMHAPDHSGPKVPNPCRVVYIFRVPNFISCDARFQKHTVYSMVTVRKHMPRFPCCES